MLTYKSSIILFIEMFVIIQTIIFLYMLSKRVKSKVLNKFIHYLNARFWFNSFGCNASRWKIQKSSLASGSFWSQWLIIWTLISLCVPLWLKWKKCSTKISCLNPRLSSLFSLILDLYWLNLSLNLAAVDPTNGLRHT